MPRFFLPADLLANRQFAVLEGEHAAHAKVLRLRCGDAVTLCDAQGNDYHGTISDVSAGRYSVVMGQAEPSRAEPLHRISVYMAFAKSDKLEHVIQKATELGAFEIVAFPSARCVSRPDDGSLSKKCERWQKIAAAAAEQCGRGRIPQVLALTSYAQALSRAAQADLPVLLYENEQKRALRAAVDGSCFQSASLVTGPEGGFDPEEVSQATAAGLQICSLGPRILRCETAPLCALSALMYASGELDER